MADEARLGQGGDPVRYAAGRGGWGGWLVYAVDADGWHSAVRRGLSESAAISLAAEMTAALSVGADGEHTPRGRFV